MAIDLGFRVTPAGLFIIDKLSAQEHFTSSIQIQLVVRVAFDRTGIALLEDTDDAVRQPSNGIELVEDEWARHPHHAAEDLNPDAARDVVNCGVEAARRIVVREMRAALKRARERGKEVRACAVWIRTEMAHPQAMICNHIAR